MQATLLGLLVLAVIFVNGWTDAPNSITTVVATKVLSFRRAALLAAICDLCGVLVMSFLYPTVAQTIFSMVDFGNNAAYATTALQAALLSIVLWAILAWYFGIPTSESHALIAGLTGSALALHGGFSGISASAWCKVLIGLVLSILCGTFLGALLSQFIKRLSLRKSHIHKGQIFSAGAMAFLHGAQDGQKFLALFLLTHTLSQGNAQNTFSVPPSLALLCAFVMSAGVFCGGKRIVEKVSQSINHLNHHEGLGADLAGALCLLIASFGGLPISTTHTKISAIFGASMANGSSQQAKAMLGQILFAWLATFPCCGFLAWALTKLMLM